MTKKKQASAGPEAPVVDAAMDGSDAEVLQRRLEQARAEARKGVDPALPEEVRTRLEKEDEKA